MQSFITADESEKRLHLLRLAQWLGCPDDPERAERIARTVLHTLRSSLSLEASIRLLRLLPLPFKYCFIEDWHPSHYFHPFASREELVSAVQKNAGRLAFYDFPTQGAATQSITAILHYIEQQVPEHRRRLFAMSLPAQARAMLEKGRERSAIASMAS